MQTKPKRLMARVACHQEAIAIARRAGFTWKEIGERLGASGAATRKAFSRAQAAMQAGRLVPMEQAPLPEPPDPPAAPQPYRPAPQTPKTPISPTTHGAGQSNKDFLASLEQIGGKR